MSRSPLGGSLADVPLQVHARYQREEILAALDFPRLPNSFREGVFYFAERNVDAFFVTLKKSEADYSPTTMYADYPISRDLFHWESQSTTSVSSPTGRRYLDGSSTVLLFVRQEQKDDFGTSPVPVPGSGHVTCHTPATVRSRSRGSCRPRCRQTSSTTRPRSLSRLLESFGIRHTVGWEPNPSGGKFFTPGKRHLYDTSQDLDTPCRSSGHYAAATRY